ncbi:MAG TPA: DUF2905 family protein [Rhizomicrobium sp.]|jgi:hypothetical protein|nr:DUF2905 family protein [Rhizomicrobium sp.]
MRRLLVLLAILLAGAAILSPIIMAFEPDPLPGDFTLGWENHHVTVPVAWSLCASAFLTLLYSFYRR